MEGNGLDKVILSRKEAISQCAKRYYTGRPCKHEHIAERQVSNGTCMLCARSTVKRWYMSNREDVLTYARQYNETRKDHISHMHKVRNELEGYCTYLALYPSGRYAGSGQTAERRRQHLSGNSAIARKVGEKATSFEVLFKGTKVECMEQERLLIARLNVDSLLNTDTKPK